MADTDLKRSVAELCDLIDQYLDAKNSDNTLALILGPSIADLQDKARELRNKLIFGATND